MMKQRESDTKLDEIKNQEMPRNEFEDVLKNAYHQVKMTENEKNQIKENLFKKNRSNSRLKMSYKAGMVVAAVLVFVAVNVAIVGLNLRYDTVVENQTGDNTENTSEIHTESNELLNVTEGVVIYSISVNPYVLESYGDGYYVTSKSYTAQIVLEKMAVTGSDELNDKLNNEEKITGDFLIRIVDDYGNIKSESHISSGGTSEHGISLNTDKESLDEYFYNVQGMYSNDDMVIFRYPIGEENGQKCYLTSFYGVDENGNIFLYEVDEEIPKDVWPYSNFELVTSENFRSVANEPGLWQDYRNLEDENMYIFYNFDVDDKKIKLYHAYKGTAEGEDVDAALKTLQIKYDILRFTARIPLESEEMVKVVREGDNQNTAIGYQQIDKNIATNEEELLDYIENSVTSLNAYGISNRDELRKKLFVEQIDMFYIDQSKLLMDDVPPFKMIDGKLCYCYVYRGASYAVTDHYVSQKVDESNRDYYCTLTGVDNVANARVRMMKQNDGVWRAVEFEEIELTTQRKIKEVSYNEQVIEDGINSWAKVFCDRDGERIQVKCTQEVWEQFKQQGFVYEDDESEHITFGYSSPWPVDSETGYKILSYDEDEAEILYYAKDSASHVVVWKEIITFETYAVSIKITSEELQYFDDIESEEELFEAYPDGVIKNTPMDYNTNGMGEKLLKPEESALYLLNISNDKNKVQTTIQYSTDSNNAYVSINFTRSGGHVDVVMEKLQNDGIWIPVEIEHSPKENVLHIMKTDMDNDGIDDYIVTSIHEEDEKDWTPDEILTGGGLLYVRVYKGTGNDPQTDREKFYNLDCLWWHEYSSARPGNGQVSVVRKDGKNYLLTSNLVEMQGLGDYSYQVISLENALEEYVDEYAVQFAFDDYKSISQTRWDVVPEFKNRIEKWFDNAALLVSIDGAYYITTDENILMPDIYYDTVWNRGD